MNPNLLPMILALLQQQQQTQGLAPTTSSGPGLQTPMNVNAGLKKKKFKMNVNANLSPGMFQNQAVNDSYADPYIPNNPNSNWTGGPYF